MNNREFSLYLWEFVQLNFDKKVVSPSFHDNKKLVDPLLTLIMSRVPRQCPLTREALDDWMLEVIERKRRSIPSALDRSDDCSMEVHAVSKLMLYITQNPASAGNFFCKPLVDLFTKYKQQKNKRLALDLAITKNLLSNV